jgi:hypothetical protein
MSNSPRQNEDQMTEYVKGDRVVVKAHPSFRGKVVSQNGNAVRIVFTGHSRVDTMQVHEIARER